MTGSRTTAIRSVCSTTKNVAFAIRMIGDVANAAVLPVKKGMPEETKKELDKYFHRENEKEEK